MYDLGSRLKAIRNKRGLTQKALAARINKSVAAISGYESNVQIPPTDVLLSISAALHVPITYFVEVDSEESYSVRDLSTKQRELVEMLFQEFCDKSEPGKELSARQIEIIRRLLLVFSRE